MTEAGPSTGEGTGSTNEALLGAPAKQAEETRWKLDPLKSFSHKKKSEEQLQVCRTVVLRTLLIS